MKNHIKLRKLESKKKEEKVRKINLDASNQCKNTEEHRYFDYYGLREEFNKRCLDEGRAFEDAKCAAHNILVVSHEIEKKDESKHELINRKIICGHVRIISLMKLLLVISLCSTNFELIE